MKAHVSEYASAPFTKKSPLSSVNHDTVSETGKLNAEKVVVKKDRFVCEVAAPEDSCPAFTP